MEKTIKYLEDKGFLKRLRNSKNISEAIFESLVGKKRFDEANKKALRNVIAKEIANDLELLNIVLDEVSDEIIKHI